MSKSHPGQSAAYNHKKSVRDNRHIERDLHKQAMNLYKEQQLQAGFSKEDIDKDIAALEKKSKTANAKGSRNWLNRNAVKRIKKDLVQTDPKFKALSNKFAKPLPDLYRSKRAFSLTESVNEDM